MSPIVVLGLPADSSRSAMMCRTECRCEEKGGWKTGQEASRTFDPGSWPVWYSSQVQAALHCLNVRKTVAIVTASPAHTAHSVGPRKRKGQRRDDPGSSAERIAENHGPAVLCAVRSNQVLPALEAGLVELVSFPEQGALQTGRADEP
jgi:hypothetical protein